MAKGEALDHTVNLEPWCRHHILCTHSYLLYQMYRNSKCKQKNHCSIWPLWKQTGLHHLTPSNI